MLYALLLAAAGFAVSFLAAPAGISGAFLLLPLQVSVLGVPASAATASTLLYNVVSTPGGIIRYRQESRLDLVITRLVLIGSIPGVIVGAVLRVTVFSSAVAFKGFVGVVLIALAAKLLFDTWRALDGHVRSSARPASVIPVAAAIGVVGGIYGIGGGSILAPYLVAIGGYAVGRVAGAALVSTLVTSLVGLVALTALGYGPRWGVGLGLGVGGLLGSYAGAAMQRRFSENWLRVLIAGLAGAVGVSYVGAALKR